MSDNITALEQRINQFEALIKEMKEVTREAHSALKQVRQERKEIERLLSTEIKALVHRQAEAIVKVELDKIGPELTRLSDGIYAKVGLEADRMIDLCLGKDFAVKSNRKDLRPDLADHLRAWIKQIIAEEDEVIFEL